MSIVSKIFGLINGTNPANPASGRRILFAKSDGWYDKDSAGVVTKFATANDVQASYLVYTALLTQSGTNAPVATVLENTLGGTVVWSYSDVGRYVGTLSGAFTSGKTAIFCNLGVDLSNPFLVRMEGYRNNLNTVEIRLYDPINDNTSNDVLGTYSTSVIEIRVYP